MCDIKDMTQQNDNDHDNRAAAKGFQWNCQSCRREN